MAQFFYQTTLHENEVDVTPRSPYWPVQWSFEEYLQMIKILSNIYLLYFQALNPDTVIISQFFRLIKVIYMFKLKS